MTGPRRTADSAWRSHSRSRRSTSAWHERISSSRTQPEGTKRSRTWNKQLQEDPLSWGASWALAVAYRSVGRDAEADTRYAQLADVGPWSAIPAVVLSGNHLARDQIHEALAFAETAYAKNPDIARRHRAACRDAGRTGNHERSQALVNQLLPGTTFGAPFGLALYYLATGDLDRCADWLEKAIEQRDPWVSFLLNVGNIGGRVMWSSPRWPRLAQLMNVTPERPVT